MGRNESKRIPCEELYRLYWDEGLSSLEIGRKFNISDRTIRRWLKECNIPRRPAKKMSIQEKYRYKIAYGLEDTSGILESLINLQKKIEEDKSDKEIELNIDTDSEWIGIVMFSDLHIGALDVDYEKMKKDFKIVANNPDLYAFVLGDIIDNFTTAMGKGNEGSTLVSPLVQWRVARELLDSLGDSLLVIVGGDHDLWTRSLVGIDGLHELSKGLNCIYLRWGGMIHLKFNNVIYDITIRHRYRTNSRINPTKSVKDMLKEFADFDIGVIAHGHVPAIEYGYLRNKRRNYIRTGSYKKSDDFLDKIALKGFTDMPVVIVNTRKKISFVLPDVYIADTFLKNVDKYEDY